MSAKVHEIALMQNANGAWIAMCLETGAEGWAHAAWDHNFATEEGVGPMDRAWHYLNRDGCPHHVHRQPHWRDYLYPGPVPIGNREFARWRCPTAAPPSLGDD